MQSPRRQFFSGSALTFNQHGRVGGRHALEKLVDVFHAGAFSNQAPVLADLHRQALVLLLQPVQAPGILQCTRGDPCDRRHQLQVLFGESVVVTITVEIHAPNHTLKYGQGHAQKRADLGFRQARDLPQLLAAGRNPKSARFCACP